MTKEQTISPIPVLFFLNVLFPQLYYTLLSIKNIDSLSLKSPTVFITRATHIIHSKKYLLFGHRENSSLQQQPPNIAMLLHLLYNLITAPVVTEFLLCKLKPSSLKALAVSPGPQLKEA